MATPKKAVLIFEMGGKKLTVKEIEDAVYCVDGDGKTTKVPLVSE